MSHTETKITTSALNREGFAMVTTILVVLILSVMAVGVAWIATSEKKTTFAESVHMQSVFSADAGGESGINFLRMSDTPPPIINFATKLVRSQGSTTLQGSQAFEYDAFFLRKRLKPGWGLDYLDYDYLIESKGAASHLGESGVDLVASRLYMQGY